MLETHVIFPWYIGKTAPVLTDLGVEVDPDRASQKMFSHSHCII